MKIFNIGSRNITAGTIFVSLALILASCSSDSNDTDQPDENPAARTLCNCDELIQIEAYNKMHIIGSDDPFTGKCELFHPNKQLAEERPYDDGKITGKVTRWHPNGQIKTEQSFIKNRQTGIGKEWDENGNLIWHASYDNGKMIKELSVDSVTTP